ncbi:MAG: glycosyltransferase, partial [Bacteroidetes bacterium]|nr:glycosyltransferase [Bacteroidota bacterium]
MDIIFISFDGMTDPLGQSQVIPYLIGLSEAGYKIGIISCEKPHNYILNQANIKQILSEKGINWYPIPYSTGVPVFSQYYNFARLKSKAEELAVKHQVKLIHCRSYLSALIGLQLQKKFGIKWIFDMRGFWADERIDGNIWRKSNFIHHRLYVFFKNKELEFLNNASHIISLTQQAKEEILTWKNIIITEDKFTIIPCSTDLSLFSNPSGQVKNTNFTLSYLGSIGTWYMLREMLDFFKILLKKIPEAEFLFVTKDDPNLIYSEALKTEIPSSKIKVKAAGRNEVPGLISQSHLSIFFIKPAYSKKASSPTKLGELLSLGIPIITNKGIGDVDKVLREENVGILINSFTNNDYQDAVNEIENALIVPPERLRAVAKRHFSLYNA